MTHSANPPQNTLTTKQILVFWIPLAATWLMMSTEGPYLAAIIARMTEAKFNLAAHGVAFSIALVIEAPVIMLMSASTALVTSRTNYLKLRNFTMWLNGLTTVGILFILIPPVFQFIAIDLLNLPDKVAQYTYIACAFYVPWPGAIGARRFYHGILIRNGKTRKVAYGTVIRLGSMTVTAILLFMYSDLPGAATAAASLSAGVVMECIASRIMVTSEIRSLLHQSDKTDVEALSYTYIAKFYFPLALTPMIALGAQPIVTFFITHAQMPLDSLAVFPVIHALAFVFRSMGLSFMEVVVANVGPKGENYTGLRNFATVLALATATGMGLIAFTSLFDVWFITISQLPIDLAAFAYLPTAIFVVIPALSVQQSFLRGVFVNLHRTLPITIATALELVVVITSIAYFVFGLNLVGAVAGVLALILGRFAANAYLLLNRPKFA